MFSSLKHLVLRKEREAELTPRDLVSATPTGRSIPVSKRLAKPVPSLQLAGRASHVPNRALMGVSPSWPDGRLTEHDYRGHSHRRRCPEP